MPIQVTALTEPDIQGAITTIQLAFANDPYNRWVYDDRSKVNPLTLYNSLIDSFLSTTHAFPEAFFENLTYHRSTSHVIASLLAFAVDGASGMRFSMSPKRPEVTTSWESQCGCLLDLWATGLLGANGCGKSGRVGGSGAVKWA
jgi:hypothetical protein